LSFNGEEQTGNLARPIRPEDNKRVENLPEAFTPALVEIERTLAALRAIEGNFKEDLLRSLANAASVVEGQLKKTVAAAEEAGPCMCAGVTVYNALRNSGARAGDLVAVHGIGGLGHLGVQYSRQMGFETVALGRGKDKEPLAKKLGAHHYIDSATGNAAAAELQKLGGAKVILATAPSAAAISPLVDGLSPDGKLIIPAAPNDPLSISASSLFLYRRSVAGAYSGSAKEAEETLAFSALTGVRPMIEKYPLSRVAEAYEQMHSGKVRFRAVLTMGE